ncbi:glucose-1-phosphate adenylyltransferase, partial [Verrucomicrobia bacterium]|nr:glucose-1-phosphate adenylyltransferase [Verrucomicrobiota bacterium]
LPASKVNGGVIENTLLSDGCIVHKARLKECMLGIRSIVGADTDMERVVMMGADYYESQQSIAKHQEEGEPSVGIGPRTRVVNAIIDKNARIGSDCVISPDGKPSEMDSELFHVRDGIIVIPKNTVIPDGTVI